MPKYTPKPIDTQAVPMPREIADLIERLAENAHDVWAAQRIRDGWTWGPARNDERKEHPSLIPYADLSESEKTYDRIMVEQAIKAALALGYKISKP